MTWIKDFREGQRIQESFLVTQVSKAVTASSQPYLTITFQDKTGSIEGKLWDVRPEAEAMMIPGLFCSVSADVISFRQGLQLKVEQVKPLNPEGINLAHFTMAAPLPLKDMEVMLKTAIDSLTHAPLKNLVEALIQQYYDKFIVYPAAVKNHHEYTSGLLYHTLSMVKLAEVLLPLYQPIHRDLVIAGILLHDLGKTVEFSSPIIPKYTVEGKLIGHLHYMAAEVQAKAPSFGIDRELAIHLQHIIIAHHGKYEFGSSVMPLTKEALIVSMIDDFDAKMAMVDKALENVEEGSFTPRLFTLDDRSFYKPKKS
jgi:3'-5' exoribonuclease